MTSLLGVRVRLRGAEERRGMQCGDGGGGDGP